MRSHLKITLFMYFQISLTRPNKFTKNNFEKSLINLLTETKIVVCLKVLD